MRVRFLGRFGERAGPVREMSGSFGTVDELIARLGREDPALEAMIRAPGTIIVRDHETVSPTARLDGAAEIAFLPVVSGG